jgi:uncharacterized protein
MTVNRGSADDGAREAAFRPRPVGDRTHEAMDEVAERMGGAYTPFPETAGAVGYTHFDGPASEDNHVVVLMTKENMQTLPSQALVRIKSLDDKGVVERTFLGAVIAGPFAEPDGLKTDSSIVVAITIGGKIFLPKYHGRAHVQLLGEEVKGQVVPPRFRPKPNSPVFPLDARETASVLGVTPQPSGNVQLGVIDGHADVTVNVPTTSKSVFPRHLGILGTTGGGKSTTVAGLLQSWQRAGAATIVVDVEGEYTEIDHPTTDQRMLVALGERQLTAQGTKGLKVYHLVGRETSRGEKSALQAFGLDFSELSPYTIMDILDLNEPQRERFHAAYDVASDVLKDLKIYPANPEDQAHLLERDEWETGYPKMTLRLMIDVVRAFQDRASGGTEDGSGTGGKRRGAGGSGEADDRVEDRKRSYYAPELNAPRGSQVLAARISAARSLKIPSSWGVVLGRLWAIWRLKVFDQPNVASIRYSDLITPGQVSVIDLSDTDSPTLNNLVIAGILRGVQRAQEEAVVRAKKKNQPPNLTMVVIEEAHEFLSKERIGQMPTVFQQVARIAKRGRKRWLGLTFVTQLPQHLPDEVLGLLNNYIIHKISDSGVIDRLRRSISGLSKSQWGSVPGLAQGQALVSFTSMTQPLLVSIDPAPCRLLLND